MEFTILLFNYSNENILKKISEIYSSYEHIIQLKFILLHRVNNTNDDNQMQEIQKNIWKIEYMVSDEEIYEYFHTYNLPMMYSFKYRMYSKAFVSYCLSLYKCFKILTKYEDLLDTNIMLLSRFDTFFECYKQFIDNVINKKILEENIGLCRHENQIVFEDRYYFINCENLFIFLSQMNEIPKTIMTITNEKLHFPEYILANYFIKNSLLKNNINNKQTIYYKYSINNHKYSSDAFKEYITEYFIHMKEFILPFSETQLFYINKTPFCIEPSYFCKSYSVANKFNLYNELNKYNCNNLLFISNFARVHLTKIKNLIKCNIFFNDNIVHKKYMICKIDKCIKLHNKLEIIKNILYVDSNVKTCEIIFEINKTVSVRNR